MEARRRRTAARAPRSAVRVNKLNSGDDCDRAAAVMARLILTHGGRRAPPPADRRMEKAARSRFTLSERSVNALRPRSLHRGRGILPDGQPREKAAAHPPRLLFYASSPVILSCPLPRRM
ncbi:hypothetical protein EVAR_2778_1 [Eumeta japonica]|uniref:Uncharacterized protein n=1 Tax=Eumeta variegata TaxID=151549 RepID=A0A4C1T2H1_EUMVA|nr:hypothetical protein EVAR_2778_1 [Eumeta japonica]